MIRFPLDIESHATSPFQPSLSMRPTLKNNETRLHCLSKTDAKFNMVGSESSWSINFSFNTELKTDPLSFQVQETYKIIHTSYIHIIGQTNKRDRDTRIWFSQIPFILH